MTVNDLLKRLDKEDYDKVIVITDGVGWTNVSGKLIKDGGTVGIMATDNSIFSDDK